MENSVSYLPKFQGMLIISHQNYSKTFWREAYENSSGREKKSVVGRGKIWETLTVGDILYPICQNFKVC
jgi:hypothetical protein